MNSTHPRKKMGKLEPKQFQADTILHVYNRLTTSQNRFLVADEVGLGKTIIARGVIQKFQKKFNKVQSSEPESTPLILYVCSNSDIGKQNAKKLMANGGSSVGEGRSSRLTMLFHDEAKNKIQERQRREHDQDDTIASKYPLQTELELICLTPATSFNFGRSDGEKSERLFIHSLLCEILTLKGKLNPRLLSKGGTSFFTHPAKTSHWIWRNSVKLKLNQEIKEVISKRFELIEDYRALLQQKFLDSSDMLNIHTGTNQFNPIKISPDSTLLEILMKAIEHSSDQLNSHSQQADAFRKLRRSIIRKLRERLALITIKTLHPQLIVLDEFQNFSELLDSDAKKNNAELGVVEALFTKKTKLLLLSATPYKATTADFEHADQSHYNKFWKTLQFLFEFHPSGEFRVKQLKIDFNEYRECLQNLKEKGDVGYSRARILKIRIQNSLRQVMVRTERFRYIDDPKGGVVEPKEVTPWVDLSKTNNSDLKNLLPGTEFRLADVKYLAWLKDAFKPEQQMFLPEIWSSIPYALNLMPKDYKMISSLYTSPEGLSDFLKKAINQAGASQFSPRLKDLPIGDLDNSAPNPKVRELIRQIKSEEMFKHLWVPPTLPYYKGDELSNATSEQLTELTVKKRLIFSRWQAVPQAVSILASQYIENQLGAQDDDQSDELKLVYDKMDLAPLMFHPSIWLANSALFQYKKNNCGKINLEHLLKEVRSKIQSDFADAGIKIVKGKQDSLEKIQAVLHIMEPPEFIKLYKSTVDNGYKLVPRRNRTDEDAESNDGIATSSILRTIESFHNIDKTEARRLAKNVTETTVEFLAKIAVGSPGPAVMRTCLQQNLLNFHNTISKSIPVAATAHPEKAFAALLTGLHWPIRRFFNHPQAGLVIRKMSTIGKRSNLERAIEYCARYHLQAVLDEYAFLIDEDLPPYEKKPGERAVEFIQRLTESFKIAVGKPIYREIQGTHRLNAKNKPVRRHIAQAFGDQHSVKDGDQGKDLMRDQIRRAFNSPFWPFILITTSIGQEGLDFHRYCGDVIHWNLPHSPVAFEQREGRIQRYMGKAIRDAWLHKRNWPEFLPNSSKDWQCYGPVGSEMINPWVLILKKLKMEEKADSQDRRGLSPEWIYERNGHFARIRRWIFCHPFSKEAVAYRRMRDSVLLYRLSMGQARQDDLVRALNGQPIFQNASELDKRMLVKDLWIDLSAPRT